LKDEDFRRAIRAWGEVAKQSSQVRTEPERTETHYIAYNTGYRHGQEAQQCDEHNQAGSTGADTAGAQTVASRGSTEAQQVANQPSTPRRWTLEFEHSGMWFALNGNKLKPGEHLIHVIEDMSAQSSHGGQDGQG
jgi:hypothetical protein